MDIIIIQQLIKILDNDVQGILLFSEFFHSSRAVAYSASNFSICVSGFSGLRQSFYAELLQGLFAGSVKLILFLMSAAVECRILGAFLFHGECGKRSCTF